MNTPTVTGLTLVSLVWLACWYGCANNSIRDTSEPSDPDRVDAAASRVLDAGESLELKGFDASIDDLGDGSDSGTELDETDGKFIPAKKHPGPCIEEIDNGSDSNIESIFYYVYDENGKVIDKKPR